MEEIEQLAQGAIEHGTHIGQTSLAEFLLKEYGYELSPRLKTFLQRVCNNGYDKIGATVGKPAEDVALEVSKVMAKVG